MYKNVLNLELVHKRWRYSRMLITIDLTDIDTGQRIYILRAIYSAFGLHLAVEPMKDFRVLNLPNTLRNAQAYNAINEMLFLVQEVADAPPEA